MASERFPAFKLRVYLNLFRSHQFFSESFRNCEGKESHLSILHTQISHMLLRHQAGGIICSFVRTVWFQAQIGGNLKTTKTFPFLSEFKSMLSAIGKFFSQENAFSGRSHCIGGNAEQRFCFLAYCVILMQKRICRQTCMDKFEHDWK